MGFETAIARRVSRQVNSGSVSVGFSQRAPRLGAIVVAMLVAAFVFSPLGAVSAESPWSLFGVASVVRLGVGTNPWAIELVSDTSLVTQYAGVAFQPSAEVLTFADLHQLSTDYNVGTTDCGGGSPRFSVSIDLDADGVPDGNLFIYIGPYPNFIGCPMGWQSTGNLIGATDLRYDTSQVGGTFYDTYAHALDLLGTMPVTGIYLVVDGGWAVPGQTILVDNLRVNDHQLSARGVGGEKSARGFNDAGYNNNARIFVGTGMSWCMDKVGDLAWCNTYLGTSANDKIVMKWNADWDRGNADGWANPPYDAWTSNHWNGNVEGGSGTVWQYKIQWVAESCGADGTSLPDGGYCIWGQFEVLMDQGHDALGHYWFAHATPAVTEPDQAPPFLFLSFLFRRLFVRGPPFDTLKGRTVLRHLR